jgi:protein-tyrosine-phosphatase
MERDARGFDWVEVVTGGTDPAHAVHEVVVQAMTEVGVDLSDRTPRHLTPDELADCDIVITMGCSADDVCPATWRGDSRDWALDDPHGRSLAGVRSIRDEIEQRVDALFDELAADVSAADP